MNPLTEAYEAAKRALDLLPDVRRDRGYHELERLRLANSYTRMEALLALSNFLPTVEFWGLVGAEWNSCDNIAVYARDLRIHFARRLVSGAFPIVEAMTNEDRQYYEALPERVPIFRGCYARNKSGFSWSTSREVAMRFPFYMRYRGHGQPMLLSATVLKTKIAFITGDRSEKEVIVMPRHRRILGHEPIMVDPTAGETVDFLAATA
jgi:hypothetical protein